MKRCAHCDTELKSKDQNRARFCSMRCYGASLMHSKPSKVASRKRAQRAVPLTACLRCGSTSNLQRHHADHTKPLDVEVLCQRCHTTADHAVGMWGKGRKKSRSCSICAVQFTPRHSTNRTCSKTCLSELGRRNARKRWSTVLTDCGASGTPSCRSRQPSRTECCAGGS